MDDLSRDPSIRQVVQSPGNTMSERYDVQAYAREQSADHSPKTMSAIIMRAMPRMKMKSTRSMGSRR